MQFCLTYKLTTLRQVNIKNYPNYFLIARLTSKIFTQIYQKKKKNLSEEEKKAKKEYSKNRYKEMKKNNADLFLS